MPQKTAQFRFYAELNDFLPAKKQQKSFEYSFWGTPAVKDAIEALGIPHTEVDLILVNDQPVEFDFLINKDDRVAVFPVFESVDIQDVGKLREKPLRNPSFILDVNLGKLARLIRMTGFDSIYSNDWEDGTIVEMAAQQKRIILTRDVGLLKRSAVTHGYFVRSTRPWEQLKEVLLRFDLRDSIQPFKRCLPCNGLLERVTKQEVKGQLTAQTVSYYQEFFRCRNCGRIYWRGSHFVRMNRLMRELFAEAHAHD